MTLLIELTALVLLLWAAWLSWESLSAYSWPSVTGVILLAQLENASNSVDDPEYRPQVRYRYVVSGIELIGTRLFVADYATYNWPSVAQRQIAGLRVGGLCRVWYHPRHPERSLLRPGLHWPVALMLLMAVFFTGVALGRG
jgi:hypothetical protein